TQRKNFGAIDLRQCGQSRLMAHFRTVHTRGMRLPVLLFAVTVALPAAAQDTTPSPKKIDSIEARVQGCVTCHGQSGQGTKDGYFPRIAGKPAGYLYNQLVAFRDGNRRY